MQEPLGVLSEHRRHLPAALYSGQVGVGESVLLEWFGEDPGGGDGVGDGQIDADPADR